MTQMRALTGMAYGMEDHPARSKESSRQPSAPATTPTSKVSVPTGDNFFDSIDELDVTDETSSYTTYPHYTWFAPLLQLDVVCRKQPFLTCSVATLPPAFVNLVDVRDFLTFGKSNLTFLTRLILVDRHRRVPCARRV